VLRLALGIVAAFVAVAVGPGWFWAWFDATVTHDVRRAVATAFLQALRAGALAALAGSALGVPSLAAWAVARRRRGRPAGLAAKGLALAASTLAGLLGAEFAASRFLAWEHRLPPLPTAFDGPGEPGVIHLVVVGESSAEGQPYHPWTSVGQMVAWGLERALPGRRVEVTMLASGGQALEQAILPLTELRRRPDLILVYAGHNEFQSRYGWSRTVRHYRDEDPTRVRTELARAIGRASPLFELISEALDRQQVDAPPPTWRERFLVDHPTASPEEEAYLRYDFARRLDGVAAYARRVGAEAVLIAPPGNLADYPPARSCLSPESDAAEREAFAGAFGRARALESSSPGEAESAYRALLGRHPEFAELHYRLGRLLAARGRDAEAAGHFAEARDLDGMPMRCRGDFLAAYRDVSARHGSILVDGPALLAGADPRGLVGDDWIHDGQHPTLRGYATLAQAALDGLAARGAFGLPPDRPAPRIDPAGCAAHFGIDAARWAEVCRRSAGYYDRTAPMRYDTTEARAHAARYHRGAALIDAGTPPEDAGVPGVGVPSVRPGE
jgi:hypothetical protein